jgi:hypothetical protein
MDRPHHFCHMACLDLWRDRERYYGKLWTERMEAWIEEKGIRHAHGYSYPEMPEELRSQCKDDFRAAALAKFPMQFLTRASTD